MRLSYLLITIFIFFLGMINGQKCLSSDFKNDEKIIDIFSKADYITYTSNNNTNECEKANMEKDEKGNYGGYIIDKTKCCRQIIINNTIDIINSGYNFYSKEIKNCNGGDNTITIFNQNIKLLKEYKGNVFVSFCNDVNVYSVTSKPDIETVNWVKEIYNIFNITNYYSVKQDCDDLTLEGCRP
jgi:hypothetical protein